MSKSDERVKPGVQEVACSLDGNFEIYFVCCTLCSLLLVVWGYGIIIGCGESFLEM